MRIGRLISSLGLTLFLLSSNNLLARVEVDVLATMTGTCTGLKIGHREFSCVGVTFFHSPDDRSGFIVYLTNPEDETHNITFSGEQGKLASDDRYELTIDRMLLKSKDRPKVDGFPTALIEPANGRCTQTGNMAPWKVSNISCVANDDKGTTYELNFDSDGLPAEVMRIKATDLALEKARAKVIAARLVQRRCSQNAVAQNVLPRDRTAFILQCMQE